MSTRGLVGLFESDLFEKHPFIHFVATDLKSYYFPPHWHDSVEVICCNAGDSEITINGVKYVLQPTDIIFIPAKSIHSYHTSQHNVQDFLLNIPVSTLTLLSHNAGSLFNLSAIAYITAENASDSHPVFMELFRKIQKEFAQKKENYYEFITAYAFQIMLTLEREIKSNPSILDLRVTKEGKRNINKINECITYIEDHYQEDLTVKQLADFLGYSEAYLSHIFNQTTRYSVTDFINKTRIKAATSMLTKSDQSITDVAFQSGFNSIATFNRVFKKVIGCSPSEYRSGYKDFHA